MGKHGRFEKRKPPKKGRKVLLIVLCVVLILLTCAAAAVVMLYQNMVGKINHVEVEDREYTMTNEILAMMGSTPTIEATEATSEPTTVPMTETTAATEPGNKEPDILNILVIGQAARAGEESRLADTLILVTINKDTRVLTLTSFPRDTYVDLPDYKGHPCGWNRINTNYALGYVWGGTGGAMEMTNLCIQNNFGIEVDYDIEVGFEAFEKVIDVLGGVRMDLTKEEADYINNMHKEWLQEVTPGENRLFGATALEYARMRKAEGDSDSDLKRTARQRKLLSVLFAKIASKGVSTIQDLANEVLPLVSTNMTQDQITECLFDVLPLLPGMTLEQGTCPVEGTSWPEYKETPDGPAYVQCFVSEQQKNLMMPITEGRMP